MSTFPWFTRSYWDRVGGCSRQGARRSFASHEAFGTFMAATKAFDPDPHFEID